MGKKTDERLRSPFGNLRLHVSCFSPIKKGGLFPAEAISRKRSLFLFPVYFPDGCISVNVW